MEHIMASTVTKENISASISTRAQSVPHTLIHSIPKPLRDGIHRIQKLLEYQAIALVNPHENASTLRHSLEMSAIIPFVVKAPDLAGFFLNCTPESRNTLNLMHNKFMSFVQDSPELFHCREYTWTTFVPSVLNAMIIGAWISVRHQHQIIKEEYQNGRVDKKGYDYFKKWYDCIKFFAISLTVIQTLYYSTPSQDRHFEVDGSETIKNYLTNMAIAFYYLGLTNLPMVSNFIKRCEKIDSVVTLTAILSNFVLYMSHDEIETAFYSGLAVGISGTAAESYRSLMAPASSSPRTP